MDVSVIIDNGRPWAEIRELALAAEELGVHAIYVCDHFMEHRDDDTTGDEPFLECGTLLAGAGRGHRPSPARGAGHGQHLPAPGGRREHGDHDRPHQRRAGRSPGWAPAGRSTSTVAYGIDLLPPADLSDRFEETVAVVSSLLLRRSARPSRARTSG